MEGASGISGGQLLDLDGKQVRVGTNADLDVKMLIEANIASKERPIGVLEDKVEINSHKISAYGTFKQKLGQFKGYLDVLRSPTGFTGIGQGTFDKRIADISINSESSASNYMNVVCQGDAIVNDYEITIEQLAKAKEERSISFSTRDSSVTESSGGTSAGMFSAGTFQINSSDVTINAGDSLESIVTAINSVTSDTNVVAYIMKIADDDYKISLKSTVSGVDNEYTITDPYGALTEASFSTIQSAENARIILNGETIERPTNEVDGVIDNVIFSLSKETNVGEILTVSIDNDIDAVIQDITLFMSAYNELLIFKAEQTAKDADGVYEETAYLGQDRDKSLENIVTNITNELMRTIDGLNVNGYARLADVNLTFERHDEELGPDGEVIPAFHNGMWLDKLTQYDVKSLEESIRTNFDAVRKVFEFDFSANSPDINVFERGNQIAITSFEMNVDDSRDEGDQVRITYSDEDGNYHIINADYEENSSGFGAKIIGQEGTVIEGLTLLYTGSGSDVMDIKMTQGIADRVYNIIDSSLDSVDGAIKQSIDSLQEDSKSKQEKIDKLNEKLEKYKKSELSKYAQLDANVGQSKTSIQYLQAQMNVNNKD